MRLHYYVGRLLSPFHIAFFYLYNRLLHVPRARVLVWNEEGELLLVRNWAGARHWGLPGGGVEKNERPIAAARRELFEEIGVKVPLESLSHVETVPYHYEAWIYSVTVLKSALPDSLYNPWEITDVRWFTPDELPVNLSPLIPLALKKLSKSD